MLWSSVSRGGHLLNYEADIVVFKFREKIE
jgi:hypothetical protein